MNIRMRKPSQDFWSTVLMPRFCSSIPTYEVVASSESPLRMFVFDMEAINVIDVTGLEAMEEIRAELASKGIKFVVARAKFGVRDKLSRAGYLQRIGATNFHPSVRSAVQSGLNEPVGMSEGRQKEPGSEDDS